MFWVSGDNMSWSRENNLTAGSNAGGTTPVAGLKTSIIPDGVDSSKDL